MEEDEAPQVSAMLNSTVEPEPGLRIFVNNLNTYLGRNIVEKLRNDRDVIDERSSHYFFGTVKQDKIDPHEPTRGPVPPVVMKIVKPERTKQFRSFILDCDVVIYDIVNTDPGEVDYVVKALKTANLKDSEKRKTLVLISSVMTWANTPPKLKKKPLGEDEAGEEEQPPEDGGEEAEAQSVDSVEQEQEQGEPEVDDEGNPINPPDYHADWRYFKESDHFLRVADENFEAAKSLETLALSMLKTQPKVDVYILCAGMLYGQGEIALYEHFKAAWLQSPSSLPVIGNGENLVPTIHVLDLATLVGRVVNKLPKVNYILAIDKTKATSQKAIIQGISDGMGAKAVSETEEAVFEKFVGGQWKNQFAVDLKMKPSVVFKDEQPEEGEELEVEEQDEEKQAELERKRKFQWHCEKGIAENMDTLNLEYNLARGLKPVKVFVTGPPGCGKSYLAHRLAKYYNIPHITIKETIEEIKAAPGQFPLLTQLREKIDAIREQMVADLEEQKGEDDPEIDPSTLHIHIPEKLIYKIFKWKLTQNDCRNRGYILDGFPREFKDAQYLFLKKQKKVNEEGEEEQEEEEEEDDEEGEGPDFESYEVDREIAPSSVIALQAEDDVILERIMNLTEKEIQGTHLTEADTQRRLKKYRAANQSQQGEPSVADFFVKRSGIDLYAEKLGPELSDVDKITEACKIYIERLGRPRNYMTGDAEAEEQRVAEAVKKAQQVKVKYAQQRAMEERVEKMLRVQREAQLKHRIEEIKEEEKEQIENKSLTLISYFNDNLVSILSDGLSDVCKKTPADPLEHLAKYLFKRANDVPDPDPWNFS